MYKFKIKSKDFHWIDYQSSSSEDLCLHGIVEIKINNQLIKCDCCVSAAALKFLKTINENHVSGLSGNHILPCCGNTLIANPELDNVEIVGCDNGVDFDVRHDGDFVIISSSEVRHKIPIQVYTYEVLKFAHEVKKFYDNSEVKLLPNDEFERDGYIAFWNEWNRRFEDAKYKINTYTLLDLDLQ